MKNLKFIKKYENITDIIASAASFISAFALIILFLRTEREKYALLILAAAFIVFACVFLVFNLIRKKAIRITGIVLSSLLALSFILFSVTPAIVKNTKDTKYSVQEVEREIFKDKSVLVFVPHEDDEINVMAGVIEQYLKSGSTVRIVFTTNGDYYGLAETRIREAIDCAAFYGIPEENLIFLGYGDEWNTKYGHIYNAPDGEVITSHIGKTQTYGTKDVKPYKNHAYTRENYLNDFISVIDEFLPDVIFSVDYDHHPDHRAVSLFFEEAMGHVLAENENYTPDVFKGFAYSLAWEGRRDFYSDNLKRTVQDTDRPNDFNHMEETEQYIWKDRVRFPVDGDTLAYTVYGSSTYEALSFHASQNANERANEIINSDKVFFRRDTSSILYNAKISVSSNSKDSYKLNDFKISDSDDISIEYHKLPLEGAWIPDDSDKDKKISVTLDEPSYISEIRLYDYMDEECNILNCEITFDDGSKINTGKLDEKGGETKISFDGRKVSSFEIKITDYSGEKCGICEIEAYSSNHDYSDDAFIKLIDEESNFAYDYMSDGESVFSLYAYETTSDVNEYEITTEGDISAEVKNGKIYVKCKRNKSGVLMVKSKLNSAVYDKINIRNSNVFTRVKRKSLQNMAGKWNFASLKEYYSDLLEYITEKF